MPGLTGTKKGVWNGGARSDFHYEPQDCPILHFGCYRERSEIYLVIMWTLYSNVCHYALFAMSLYFGFPS